MGPLSWISKGSGVNDTVLSSARARNGLDDFIRIRDWNMQFTEGKEPKWKAREHIVFMMVQMDAIITGTYTAIR
jgi:hypothetical protein